MRSVAEYLFTDMIAENDTVPGLLVAKWCYTDTVTLLSHGEHKVPTLSYYSVRGKV